MRYLPKNDGYFFFGMKEIVRLSYNELLEGPYGEFCMVPVKHFEDGGFSLLQKRFFLHVMFFLGIAHVQLSLNPLRLMSAYYINCLKEGMREYLTARLFLLCFIVTPQISLNITISILI